MEDKIRWSIGCSSVGAVIGIVKTLVRFRSLDTPQTALKQYNL